jgi:hypothetical protein
MNKPHHNRRPHEHGNVLIYILIAVALLGALSFAVSQGGRNSGKSITEEKARLYAGEMLEYGNTVGNAVAQLRLRGCTETQISFEFSGAGHVNNNAPDDNSCHVFHPSGGGVTFKSVTPEAMANGGSQNYIYSAFDNVEGVGTDDSELIMYGIAVSDEVCIQINKMIGTVSGDTLVEDPADVVADPFVGTYGSNVTIGTGTGDVFEGVRTGCFFCGPYGENIFYKVLIAR